MSLQFNELKYTSSAQTGRGNIQQEIQQWQNNTVSVERRSQLWCYQWTAKPACTLTPHCFRLVKTPQNLMMSYTNWSVFDVSVRINTHFVIKQEQNPDLWQAFVLDLLQMSHKYSFRQGICIKTANHSPSAIFKVYSNYAALFPDKELECGWRNSFKNYYGV